jgi:hypothetical protein
MKRVEIESAETDLANAVPLRRRLRARRERANRAPRPVDSKKLLMRRAWASAFGRKRTERSRLTLRVTTHLRPAEASGVFRGTSGQDGQVVTEAERSRDGDCGNRIRECRCARRVRPADDRHICDRVRAGPPLRHVDPGLRIRARTGVAAPWEAIRLRQQFYLGLHDDEFRESVTMCCGCITRPRRTSTSCASTRRMESRPSNGGTPIEHARLARRSACSGGLGHGDRSYQTPRKPCEPGARDGRDSLIPTEGANSRRDRSPAADTIELRRAAPRAGSLGGCPISPLRTSAPSTAAAGYLRKESAPAVATADPRHGQSDAALVAARIFCRWYATARPFT